MDSNRLPSPVHNSGSTHSRDFELDDEVRRSNNNACKDLINQLRYIDEGEDSVFDSPTELELNSENTTREIPMDGSQSQQEHQLNHDVTVVDNDQEPVDSDQGPGLLHRILSGQLLLYSLPSYWRRVKRRRPLILTIVVILFCVLVLVMGLVIWNSSRDSGGEDYLGPLDPAESKWTQEESYWKEVSTEDTGTWNDAVSPATGENDDSSHSSGVKTFRTENSDHYRILHVDSSTDSVIIGARNMVFNISMKSSQSLKVNKEIEWTSDSNVINVCKSRGNSEEDCQNYIRVIVNQTEEMLFICGTNAFKPACRMYKNTPESYEQISQESGVAKCPFDPRQNNTYLYADGQLYSGTVADINVRDPLIYRVPMRTEQYDSQVLNDPDFVNSYDYGENVYFFFREFAVEYINCGKAVYSRVGRICKKDKGGLTVLSNVWTSFFKSRLNCSIPGDFPFYFDEIQSTTELGKGYYKPVSDAANRTDMIYGVFNTPQNSISGSAICAFRMSDVIASFEGGFKEQKSAHSTWLPVNERGTPKPHPATCNNNSQDIPIQTLNFIKSHPLMDMAVPTFGGRPILVQTSLNSRMTQIAVDWQRPGTDGRFYDVLFIGTSDGTVIKAINRGLDKIDSVIIEEIRVFKPNTPVTGVKVYRSENGDPDEKLIVISKSSIKTLPLHRCGLQRSCSACVGLRDPYCSWDNKKCRPNTKNGIQNIDEGTGCTGPETTRPKDVNVIASSSAPTSPPCVCPEQKVSVQSTADTVHQATQTTTDADSRAENRINFVEPNTVGNNNHINIIPEGRSLEHKDPAIGASTQARGDTVNASTLAISLVFSILIALCVGFFAGYRTSLYRHKSHSDDLFMSSSKNDTHKTLNRFDDPNHYNSRDYTPQPHSGKQLNVVFNPLKSNTKQPNGHAETKVQQKVKKVYL